MQSAPEGFLKVGEMGGSGRALRDCPLMT